MGELEVTGQGLKQVPPGGGGVRARSGHAGR